MVVSATRMTLTLYHQPRFRDACGSEFRPGGLPLTAELAELCRLTPGLQVLDLGCGVGSTASFLARQFGVETVGLDSSSASLAEAQANDQGVSWVLGRAEQIPFPDNHFDVCMCECFLSAVEEPAVVLREIRRVLRPTGLLAVTDVYLRRPSAGDTLKNLSPQVCLRGALGQQETKARFDDGGFEVCFWQDRSDALKSLMAALVFAYGSSATFWKALLGEEAGQSAVVQAARPGYYLLLARPRPAAA